jgi:predicted ABC-type ATPase
MRKKRLRIFAGPNGSGKSTIKNIVSSYVKLGTYVNADEIKVELTNKRCLDFSDYEVDINKKEFIESLQSSSYSTIIKDVDTTLSHVSFQHSTIIIDKNYEVEDYFVSFIAAYIREKLLEDSNRFTFETGGNFIVIPGKKFKKSNYAENIFRLLLPVNRL